MSAPPLQRHRLHMCAKQDQHGVNLGLQRSLSHISPLSISLNQHGIAVHCQMPSCVADAEQHYLAIK